MIRTASTVALAAALLWGCAPAGTLGSTAEPPLDRSVMPEPGPQPEVDFPEIQRFTLSNGLPVWLVERPGVSLVTVQLLMPTGAVSDPAELPGLASLTAAMLTEGTTNRSATQIAEEIDFLAAHLDAGTGRETAVVTLTTLARTFEPALDILADVVINPAFQPSDWQRIQQQRLTSLLQSLDQPAAIAGQEFARIVYGEHPYGRPLQGTPESVQAISPEDLREFHRTHYSPRNASLVVVGDVDDGALRRQLEAELGGWQGGNAPAFVSPPRPPSRATRVYLIDKPGAAQSEIRIGHEGIERDHRDYFPILVLNALLGGEFSSRINMNLREDKGYTYGANSSFQMGRIAGPFVTGAAVQSAVTKESVVEFMRELQEIRTGRPPTAEEVARTRTALVRREPLRLETNAQIASRLTDLIHFQLPPDYFDNYTDQIAAVTVEDVHRVAREHLDPEEIAIVIVGDRATIEQDLRTLEFPVEIVAIQGTAVPAPVPQTPQ